MVSNCDVAFSCKHCSNNRHKWPTRARRAKLPLVINEGKTRPLVHVIAAMFATECNITVRNHLPVFKHWKEYKKRPLLLEQFMGSLKVSTDFTHLPL
jgi:hypothetical protein